MRKNNKKNQFSKVMQEKRMLAGLSQEVLSYESGLSTVSISKYESGRAIPRLDNALCISKILSIDLNKVEY